MSEASGEQSPNFLAGKGLAKSGHARKVVAAYGPEHAAGWDAYQEEPAVTDSPGYHAGVRLASEGYSREFAFRSGADQVRGWDSYRVLQEQWNTYRGDRLVVGSAEAIKHTEGTKMAVEGYCRANAASVGPYHLMGWDAHNINIQIIKQTAAAYAALNSKGYQEGIRMALAGETLAAARRRGNEQPIGWIAYYQVRSWAGNVVETRKEDSKMGRDFITDTEEKSWIRTQKVSLNKGDIRRAVVAYVTENFKDVPVGNNVGWSLETLHDGQIVVEITTDLTDRIVLINPEAVK